MIDPASAHLRIARPTADLDAAIRFRTDGPDTTLQGRRPSEQGRRQGTSTGGVIPWSEAESTNGAGDGGLCGPRVEQ
jgi:hypothetical protein